MSPRSGRHSWLRLQGLLRPLLTLLALALFLTAVAWATEPRPRSALEGVKELEKPVTYTEAKIPLGELVQRVAADTGAPLTASREVADEPVMLCVRDFPARELLEQLADLLDYRWTRRTGEGTRERESEGATGRRSPATTPPPPTPQHPNTPTPQYVIYQDLASRQREEALREKLFGEVEKRLWDQIRTYAEFAALPPAELERVVEDAKRHSEAMRKLSPEQSDAYFRVPQNRQRGLRFGAAQALQTPIQGTLARLLVSLPEARWTALRDGDELLFSTDPKAGELRLPAELERRLQTARPTVLAPGSRLAYPTPEEEEKLRRRDQELQEAWAAATGFRVRVRLDLQSVRTQAAADLQASVEPFRSGGRLDLPFLYTGTELRLYSFVIPRELPEEEPPAPRAALETDPVFGAKQLFKPQEKPHANDNGPTAPPWWRLVELLPQLARTYDVHFLSDAYWTRMPTLYLNRLPADPAALSEILERATADNHRWDRRGRLIRLRSRYWFLDRAREVPLRLVRRWKALVEAHGALPVEAYAEMTTALKEPQLEAVPGVADQVGLPHEVGSAGFQRDALRFYAALSPNQQQALWRGGHVSVPQMSGPQRALFLRALHALTRRRPTDPGQIAMGRVSMSLRPMVRTREVQGERVTFRDLRIAPGAPAPPSPPNGRADGSRRYSVLSVGLLLECGQDMQGSLDLVVPALR